MKGDFWCDGVGCGWGGVCVCVCVCVGGGGGGGGGGGYIHSQGNCGGIDVKKKTLTWSKIVNIYIVIVYIVPEDSTQTRHGLFE